MRYVSALCQENYSKFIYTDIDKFNIIYKMDMTLGILIMKLYF